MFDQKSSSGLQYSRNEKENMTNNKIEAHFSNTSFLAQQQQLNVFIKNFPVIKIDQISSINKLIGVLIKQNQMLGNRCQQNVITIKQMFTKHESIVTQNKKLKQQINQLNISGQQKNQNNEALQEYNDRLDAFSIQIKEGEDKFRDISEQKNGVQKCNNCLRDVLVSILEGNYKQGVERVKSIQFLTCLSQMEKYENQTEKITLEKLERFFKDEKKRNKYLSKARQLSDSFCNRLVKIVEIVPQKLLCNEIMKESQNYCELLEELLQVKRKSNLSNSASRKIDIKTNKQDFFEETVQAILKHHQNNSITSEQINGELISLKKELEASKNYYENYIMSERQKTEKILRQKEEQLRQKQETSSYYEEQRQTITRERMSLCNKIQTLETQISFFKEANLSKSDEILQYQEKIKNSKINYESKLTQFNSKIEEMKKINQFKLVQKQNLISELQEKRKKLIEEHEEQIQNLKKKVKNSSQNLDKMEEQLKSMKKQKQEVSSNLEKMVKENQNIQNQIQLDRRAKESAFKEVELKVLQIRQLRQMCRQNEKQKSLQVEYIRELEKKKNQIEIKNKNLESKKVDDKSNKKQMIKLKDAYIEEKKILKQSQQSVHKQKQENLRLKSLIKQMKKELQEVYNQFNLLKQIEIDKQRLSDELIRINKIKEDALRQRQIMKFEIMRLEKQNKGICLQMKHYYNALSRIQALK